MTHLAVTDEMVEIALNTWDAQPPEASGDESMRAALTAALQGSVVVSAGCRHLAALEEIGRYAKRIRKSRDLIGPAEYVHDAKSMRVWQRALYHEGKTLEGMVKAALHGADIFEPEKDATAPLPDWKQDQAETSPLPRNDRSTPTSGE